jgi:hypothetical protein
LPSSDVAGAAGRAIRSTSVQEEIMHRHGRSYCELAVSWAVIGIVTQFLLAGLLIATTWIPKLSHETAWRLS